MDIRWRIDGGTKKVFWTISLLQTTHSLDSEISIVSIISVKILDPLFYCPYKIEFKNLSECFAVFLYVYSIRAGVLFVLPSLFSESRTSDDNVLDECCTQETNISNFCTIIWRHDKINDKIKPTLHISQNGPSAHATALQVSISSIVSVEILRVTFCKTIVR